MSEDGDASDSHGRESGGRDHDGKETQPAQTASRKACQTGLEMLDAGGIAEAAGAFARALELDPENTDAILGLAMARQRQGQLAEAVALFRMALDRRPGWITAMNNLAWVLATAPDAEVRHAAAAVELARRVCETRNARGAESLDTLAAAYAANGDFDRAARIAKSALQHARSRDLEDLAEAIQNRLSLYQEGQSYVEVRREPAPSEGRANNHRSTRPKHGEDRSLQRLVRSLAEEPRGPDVLGRLAWVFATSDDPRVRDAESAAFLSEMAMRLSELKRPELLDARAAAQAEGSDFAEASQTARDAAKQARRAGNNRLAEAIVARAELYESGAPYRETVEWQLEPVGKADVPLQQRRVAYACYVAAEELHTLGDLRTALRLTMQALEYDPGYPRIQALMGRLLLDLGQPGLAAYYLQAAVQAGLEDAITLNALGLSDMQTGQLDLAIEAFRKALRLKPGWSIAANNLAWLLATHPADSARDGHEAVRLLESVVRDDVHHVAGLLDTLAAAYAAAGRFEKALSSSAEAIRLALRRGQTDSATEFSRRRLLYEAGRPYISGNAVGLRLDLGRRHAHRELATRALDLGRFDDAVRHLQAALHAAPEDSATLNDLGAALAGYGRHAEAVTVFAQAAGLEPKAAEPLLNLAWLRAATGDHRLRDPEEAVLLAELARDLGADELSVWDTLGIAYAAAGKFERAVTAAGRALELAEARELKPHALEKLAERVAGYSAGRPYRETPGPAADETRYARANAELGALALYQGRGEAAERLLSGALAARREDAELHYLLGQSLSQQGRCSEAIEQFRKSIELDPDWPAPAESLAWALATRNEVTAEQAEDAVRFAKLACEATGSRSAFTLDTLAVAYAAAGRFENAAATAKRAALRAKSRGNVGLLMNISKRFKQFRARQRYIETSPGLVYVDEAYANLYAQHGLDLAKQGQRARAIRYLQSAVAFRRDPVLINELGELARQEGRPSEAKKHFVLALRLRPDWLVPANNLAWLLATTSGTSEEEMAIALQIAKQNCESTGYAEASTLDTLAAVHAAHGSYESAVRTARRALDVAISAGNHGLAEDVRRRLRLYEREQPFRDANAGDGNTP